MHVVLAARRICGLYYKSNTIVIYDIRVVIFTLQFLVLQYI